MTPAASFPSVISYTEPLVVDHRGLVATDPELRGKHPIQSLIERGEVLARDIERKLRTIETLKDAVADYQKAFSMAPPRGFDDW